MGHVAVQRGEFAVTVHEAKQIGAHCHQVARAARGSVQPPNQLLPPRLGCEMRHSDTETRSNHREVLSVFLCDSVSLCRI